MVVSCAFGRSNAGRLRDKAGRLSRSSCGLVIRIAGGAEGRFDYGYLEAERLVE